MMSRLTSCIVLSLATACLAALEPGSTEVSAAAPALASNVDMPVHPLHDTQPYLGMHKLLKTDKTVGESVLRPKFSRHNFSVATADGGKMHLSYEVEHHDAPVLGLDTHECVRQVTCDDTSIKITMCNRSYADHLIHEFNQGGLVAGGQEWKCAGDEGDDPKVILRKTVGVPLYHDVATNTLVFKTAHAKYHDFFKTSKIRFHTNIYEEPLQHDHAPFPLGPSHLHPHGHHKRQLKRRGFGNYFTSSWNAIKSIGNKVKGVVAAVRTVAKALSTGAYSTRKQFPVRNWGWNYANGRAKDSAIKLASGVTCSDCYVMFKSSLNFELDIKSYVVKNVAVYGQADAKVNLNGVIDYKYKYSAKYSKLLATLKFSSIKFAVGPVPFVITPTVPVTVGYDMSIQASASALITATAQGTAKYGYRGRCSSRSSRSCKMNRISDHSFSRTGKLSNLKGSASLALNVHVMPTVVIDVDHIGGPNVGLKSSIEFVGSTSSSNYCRGKLGMQAQIATNFMFEATIGGKIDVHIGSTSLFKKEFAPVGIYSMKMPLGTGCFGGSPRGNRAQIQTVGTTKISSSNTGGAPSLNSSSSSSSNSGSSKAIVTDGKVPGSTWFGEQRRLKTTGECGKYPAVGKMSLQIVAHDTAASIIDFVGSINYAGEGSDAFACIVQTAYETSYYGDGDMIIKVKKGGSSGGSSGHSSSGNGTNSGGIGGTATTWGDGSGKTSGICGTFCKKGSPCTPPCRNAGCSNCRRRRMFSTATASAAHSSSAGDASYAKCTNGAPPQPYGWYGKINSDGTITGKDTMLCTTITLSNKEHKFPGSSS